MAKEFTIGKVSVPVNERKQSELIPEKTNFVIDDDNAQVAESTLLGIKMNMPVMLIGPTGCGKSALVKHIAAETNNAYRRIQINGATDKAVFVGRWLINESGTFWVDGLLTRAMRNGEILVLDELNMALPEILALLHSVMDDDAVLILDDKDGEIVRKHPDFRIIATMNPWEDYAGTKEVNRATLDRFPIVQHVSYPSKKHEAQILKAHTGLNINFGKSLDRTGIIRRACELAEVIRKKHDLNEIIFPMSTRSLIVWLKLFEHIGLKDAARIVILDKADSENDRKKIEDELNKFFREDENLNRQEIEAKDKIDADPGSGVDDEVIDSEDFELEEIEADTVDTNVPF